MVNIFVDVMDIPKIMDKYLGVTWGVAMVILPFIFVTSLVTQLHKAAEGEKPDYRSVIWTTVLVTFATLIYRVWVMKIVAICEGLGMTILNYQDWIAFITIISQKQDELGALNIFNLNISSWILIVALSLCIVIEEIFNFIRFLFLSVLYLVGPFCVVATIYQPLRTLFKGWLLSVVQVSFWIVVLRIFQATILSFNIQQAVSEGNVFVSIIVTLTLIASCILAPAFTSKLFSGQNIGLLGSTVLFGVSYVFAGKWIPAGGGKKVSVAGAVTDTVNRTYNTVRQLVSRQKTKEEAKPQQRTR